MPRFAGVPVEEPVKGPRFAGVAVEPVLSDAPKASAQSSNLDGNQPVSPDGRAGSGVSSFQGSENNQPQESAESAKVPRFGKPELAVKAPAPEESPFGSIRADDRNGFERYIDSRKNYFRNWWSGLKESTAVGVDSMRADPFRKDVADGKITGGLDDHWKMGGWSASMNNKVSSAAISGNLDELRSAVQEDRQILSAVGDKMDLSKANLMERGLKGAAGSGASMLESIGLGAYMGAIPVAGPVAGKAAVGAYWQQQGAGEFLRSFLRDKNLDELTPEKLKEYNAISQAMAVPYAAIEFTVSSIPGMKSLGSGIDQQAANWLFRKALANPSVLTKLAKGGTSFGIRWALESLWEEGAQGATQEAAGQMMDQAAKGDKKSMMDLIRGLDPEKLKTAFIESGVQSVPSVGIITAVGGGVAGMRNRMNQAAPQAAPADIVAPAESVAAEAAPAAVEPVVKTDGAPASEVRGQGPVVSAPDFQGSETPAENVPGVGNEKAPRFQGLEVPDGKIRGFADRVAEDAGLSPEQARKVVENPENYYDPQNRAEMKSVLSEMDDAALQDEVNRKADPDFHGNDNRMVLAGLELMNRKQAAGKDVLPTIETLSRNATTFAQLLSQYSELKSSNPEYAVDFFERHQVDPAGFKLNERQRADLVRLTDADIQATRQMEVAQAAFRESPGPDTQAAYDQSVQTAREVKRRMMLRYAELSPRSGASIFRNLVRGNLLVPLSQMRNLSSNVFYQQIRDTSQSIMASADAVGALVKRRARRIAFPSVRGRIVGAIEGLKEAGRSMLTGQQIGADLHGESLRGFHPMRMLKRMLTGDLLRNVNGKVPVSEYVKALVEVSPQAAAAEANFRLLAPGDEPIKLSSYRSLLYGEAKLRKLKGFAREQFIRNPPPAVQKEIFNKALESVFQEKTGVNSWLSQGSRWMRDSGKLGDWIDAVVITPLMPYKTTPINVMHSGIKLAAPGYSFARSMWFANKARTALKKNDRARYQRQASDDMGFAIVGSAMLAAGSWLASNGLVSPPADKDPKVRALQYANFKPNSLNLSGLERAMSGGNPAWQPGDKTVNLFWMGHFGLIFNLQAARYADLQQEKRVVGVESSAGGAFEQWFKEQMTAVPELASAALELTVLQGAYDVLDAVKNQRYDNLFRSYFGSATSAVLPNTLASVQRAQSEFIPDMKTDSAWKMFGDALQSKNPWLDADTFWPHKLDPLGQPIIRTPEGSNHWLYNVFDVTKTEQIRTDPVWNEIGRLYRETGNHDVIPSVPSSYLMVNGKSYTLPEDDYLQRVKVVGEARYQRIQRLVTGENWKRLSDERKVEMIRYGMDHSDTPMGKRFRRQIENKYPTWFDSRATPAQNQKAIDLMSKIGAARQQTGSAVQMMGAK